MSPIHLRQFRLEKNSLNFNCWISICHSWLHLSNISPRQAVYLLLPPWRRDAQTIGVGVSHTIVSQSCRTSRHGWEYNFKNDFAASTQHQSRRHTRQHTSIYTYSALPHMNQKCCYLSYSNFVFFNSPNDSAVIASAETKVPYGMSLETRVITWLPMRARDVADVSPLSADSESESAKVCIWARFFVLKSGTSVRLW